MSIMVICGDIRSAPRQAAESAAEVAQLQGQLKQLQGAVVAQAAARCASGTYSLGSAGVAADAAGAGEDGAAAVAAEGMQLAVLRCPEDAAGEEVLTAMAHALQAPPALPPPGLTALQETGDPCDPGEAK